MFSERSDYSPDIVIYLEYSGKRVHLSDLLHNSAKVAEHIEILPKTRAMLVLSIEGHETKEHIIIEDGLRQGETLLAFAYTNGRNGRCFAHVA